MSTGDFASKRYTLASVTPTAFRSGRTAHLASTPNDGKPGPSISCCEIAYLPPGGDYEFRLFPPYPNRFTVKVVTVHFRDGRGWIRM
jgi:hypothetical protein